MLLLQVFYFFDFEFFSDAHDLGLSSWYPSECYSDFKDLMQLNKRLSSVRHAGLDPASSSVTPL
jgi:hypothetical protein